MNKYDFYQQEKIREAKEEISKIIKAKIGDIIYIPKNECEISNIKVVDSEDKKSLEYAYQKMRKCKIKDIDVQIKIEEISDNNKKINKDIYIFGLEDFLSIRNKHTKDNQKQAQMTMETLASALGYKIIKNNK